MEKEDVDRLEKAVKDLKKLRKSEVSHRRQEVIGTMMKSAGKAMPRGIRHPDATVSNKHLYLPGVRGRTRLR